MNHAQCPSGLNCAIPPGKDAESLPQNVTLFGKSTFAEVIKVK